MGAKLSKNFVAVSFLAAILWLSGCEYKRAGNFVYINDGKLGYREQIELPCDSGGTDELVVLALRYTDEYPYRTISMEISLEERDGTKQKDTVCVELNDLTGKRLGHGLGGSYQIEKVSKLLFPPDSCMIKVCQIMRSDTVKGIEMIGVLSKKQE